MGHVRMNIFREEYFKLNAEKLGNSLTRTVKFALNQEKSRIKNQDLRDNSIAYLKELIDFKLTERVPAGTEYDDLGNSYIIPVISIIKANAPTKH